MTSDPAPEMAGDLNGYLQRAELLAELGRYDDAAAELGFAVSLAPGDPRASAMLARVHLAAGRPAEALAAAESVLAAGGVGGTAGIGGAAGGGVAGAGGPAAGGAGRSGGVPEPLRTQVIRGFALADLRRFGEAAGLAEQLLASAPADAYAQRSGAAILAESRNGQHALNAAWRGVELDPREAQAHLVLSLVAARLGLYDLAERAYREALELDPELGEAARDVGVMRLERRRYAAALEDVAESVVPAPRRPAEADRPAKVDRPAFPTPEAGPTPPPPVRVPWTGAELADGLRRLVLYGAGYAVVAAILVAYLAVGNPGLSRFVAGLAAIGGGVVLWMLAARTPGLVRTVLPELLSRDRALALAGYAALAGPALILFYALVGTPWPLVLAIAVTALAELVVLRRGLPPPPPPRR